MDEKLTVPAPGGLSYGSYLKVNPLLALQQPVAKPEQHDEMLFIVIHQVYELWFKLALHEAVAAVTHIKADKPQICNKVLRRIVAVMNVLVGQIDVIETMTPVEFNTFRSLLNPASGFQSAQFRILESTLGCKNRGFLKFYEDADPLKKGLEEALNAPTLWDETLAFLSRQGLRMPEEVLGRDVTRNHEANPGVTSQLLKVYQEPERHFAAYQMLESLMDLDEKVGLWRYRHVLMVERMIGNVMGTGGSSGVKYLSSTLSKRFFPELWQVRDLLTG